MVIAVASSSNPPPSNQKPYIVAIDGKFYRVYAVNPYFALTRLLRLGEGLSKGDHVASVRLDNSQIPMILYKIRIGSAQKAGGRLFTIEEAK